MIGLLCLAAAPVVLGPSAVVRLDSPTVRLGSVAASPPHPDRVVLRLAAGATHGEIGRAALVRLVRRAVPGGRLDASRVPAIVRFERSAPAVAHPTGALTAAPAVKPGEKLHVATRVGPVSIEREVLALQQGRPGRRMFVRAVDGTVFAAALEAQP